jgi:hypothetical protein
MARVGSSAVAAPPCHVSLPLYLRDLALFSHPLDFGTGALPPPQEIPGPLVPLSSGVSSLRCRALWGLPFRHGRPLPQPRSLWDLCLARVAPGGGRAGSACPSLGPISSLPSPRHYRQEPPSVVWG